MGNRTRYIFVAALISVLPAPLVAQPAISGTTGGWTHKATVTIQGSNFGSKATAGPVAWDDASGQNILATWTNVYPNASANSYYNMSYRAPIRGIAPPHSRVGRYIAGAHYEYTDVNAGWDVMVFKTLTNITKPMRIYASWYQRMDDNWVFDQAAPGDANDNNFKCFDWGTTRPYVSDWHGEYNPRPTSAVSTPYWHLNDNATNLTAPSTWWGSTAMLNPMGGTWSKVEVLLTVSSGTDGLVQITENGSTRLTYRGSTDNMTGTTRTFGVGGYARSPSPNNFRYYTDVYFDTSWARVVLGNASTFAACTMRELQVPTTWSSGSITVTTNLGAFKDGQTAYLYVIDSNGNANAQGFPVVLGSAKAPAAPTNVRVTQ